MHSFLITSPLLNNRRQAALSLAAQKLNLSQEKISTHPDIFIVDQASVSIKTIRQIKTWVANKPFQSKVKIVLILESQNLSLPAQHALLKTLEEPPRHTIIILTAPNAQTLLATITSRCQIISAKHKAASSKDQPNTPTLSSVDVKQINALINRLPTMSAAQKITTAKDYATNRQQAIDFCIKLQTILRQKLKNNKLINPKLLNQSHLALKRLKANVNPKLVIENLLLKSTRS